MRCMFFLNNSSAEEVAFQLRAKAVEGTVVAIDNCNLDEQALELAVELVGGKFLHGYAEIEPIDKLKGKNNIFPSVIIKFKDSVSYSIMVISGRNTLIEAINWLALKYGDWYIEDVKDWCGLSYEDLTLDVKSWQRSPIEADSAIESNLLEVADLLHLIREHGTTGSAAYKIFHDLEDIYDKLLNKLNIFEFYLGYYPDIESFVIQFMARNFHFRSQDEMHRLISIMDKKRFGRELVKAGIVKYTEIGEMLYFFRNIH